MSEPSVSPTSTKEQSIIELQKQLQEAQQKIETLSLEVREVKELSTEPVPNLVSSESIKKLNSSNEVHLKSKLPKLRSVKPLEFLAWKKRFISYLKNKKLGYVLELPTRNEANLLARQQKIDIEKYNHVSSELFEQLVRAVPRSEVTHLNNFAYGEGVDAWNELNRSVISDIEQRSGVIESQIERTQMRQFQDTKTFVNYILRLYEELEATGETVTERTKVKMIKKKLTREYDDFVDRWDSLPTHEQSLHHFQDSLRKQFLKFSSREPYKYKIESEQHRVAHRRKEYRNNTTRNQVNALQAKSKNENNRDARITTEEWLKTQQCFNCGAFGHFARDCKLPKKKNQYEEAHSISNAKGKTKCKPHFIAHIEMRTNAKRTNETEDWSLNKLYYDQLTRLLRCKPTLDACATQKSTKCKQYFSKKDDTFVQDWEHHCVYFNPPFSKLDQAYKKCLSEFKKGTVKEVLFIFPLWKENETVKKILSQNEPILLPNLMLDVFQNTERKTNKHRMPTWKVAAILLQPNNTKKKSIDALAAKRWCKQTKKGQTKLKTEKVHGVSDITVASTTERIELQLDSGASSHVMFDRSLFDDLRPSSANVSVANGQSVKVEGQGSITLDFETTKKKKIQLTLTNCLLVPSLTRNLVSVGQLMQHTGFKVDLKNELLELPNKQHVNVSKRENLFFIKGYITRQSCSSVGQSVREKLQRLRKLMSKITRLPETSSAKREHIDTSIELSKELLDHPELSENELGLVAQAHRRALQEKLDLEKNNNVMHQIFGHPGQEKARLLRKAFNIDVQNRACMECKLVKSASTPFIQTSPGTKSEETT